MIRRMLAVTLPVFLAFFITTIGYSQDAEKVKKDPQMEKKAEMKHTYHSVECAPECGFMVRSEDQKELSSIVISHAKGVHNKDITEADVKKMMKSSTHAADMKKKPEEKKMEEKK